MKKPTNAPDPVERYLEDRGARPDLVHGGLAGLVKRWAAIVEDIARGYDLTLDDYLNDMDVRDLIAGALAVAGMKDRQSVDVQLASADRKLHEVTMPSKSLWGGNPANHANLANPPNPANLANPRWWYFRRPRRAGAAFEADFSRLT